MGQKSAGTESKRDDRSRGRRKGKKGRWYKPPPFLVSLSFFLTPLRPRRFFVSIDTDRGWGVTVHQVMMYRGKFPAENYLRGWPRSHGPKGNHFLFAKRDRQTYVMLRRVKVATVPTRFIELLKTTPLDGWTG